MNDGRPVEKTSKLTAVSGSFGCAAGATPMLGRFAVRIFRLSKVRARLPESEAIVLFGVEVGGGADVGVKVDSGVGRRP